MIRRIVPSVPSSSDEARYAAVYKVIREAGRDVYVNALIWRAVEASEEARKAFLVSDDHP